MKGVMQSPTGRGLAYIAFGLNIQGIPNRRSRGTTDIVPDIASGSGKFCLKGRDYLTLFFLQSARPQRKTTGAFTQNKTKRIFE